MTKKILYGVGLVLAILMILGLIINSVLPILGINKPLTTIPIWISVVLVFGVILCIGYFKGLIQLTKLRIPLPVILVTLLPIAAIVGTELVNYTGSNLVLMIMLPMLVVVTIICMFTKVIPKQYWAYTIWMMALAVVLHRSLVSPYLIGTDSVLELRCARDVYSNGIWTTQLKDQSSVITMFSAYNTVLSITILPTMIANILFINCEWVLKLVFPILLSLVPVAVYELIKDYFSDKIAFLSAFALMSVYSFYTIVLMTQKQLIAFVFLAIFLLMYFDKKYNSKYKNVLLGMLGIGIIFSHYGTAIMFIGIIGVLALLSRKWSNIIMVGVLVCIAFTWYYSVGNSIVVNNMSHYSTVIMSNSDNGTEENPPGLIVRLITKGVSYLPPPLLILYVFSQLLICTGFIIVVWEWLKKKSKNINLQFIVISAIFLIILALEVFPSFSNLIGLDRVYIYCMMILFPLMFYAISKIKYATLISVAFVAVFFLMNIGFINQLIDKPLINSFALNPQSADDSIFTSKQLESAKWALEQDDAPIYTDNYGKYIFYYIDIPAKIIDQRITKNVMVYGLKAKKPFVKSDIPADSLIYLRKYNVNYNQLTMHYYDYDYEYTVGFPMEELGSFQEVINTARVVYENEDSKVLKTTIPYTYN